MPKRDKPRDRRLVVVSASAVEGVEIECASCGGRIVMSWEAPPPFGEGLTCPQCGADMADDALLVLRSFRLFRRQGASPIMFRVRAAVV
jgi:hypothetical protein